MTDEAEFSSACGPNIACNLQQHIIVFLSLPTTTPRLLISPLLLPVCRSLIYRFELICILNTFCLPMQTPRPELMGNLVTHCNGGSHWPEKPPGPPQDSPSVLAQMRQHLHMNRNEMTQGRRLRIKLMTYVGAAGGKWACNLLARIPEH